MSDMMTLLLASQIASVNVLRAPLIHKLGKFQHFHFFCALEDYRHVLFICFPPCTFCLTSGLQAHEGVPRATHKEIINKPCRLPRIFTLNAEL